MMEEIRTMNVRGRHLLLVVLLAAPFAAAEEAEFGVTGLTFLETARLSAFCSEHLTEVAEPCDVRFEFSDIRGRVLKATTMTIAYGSGGFLDLRGGDAGPRGSTVEIVPCVRVFRGMAVISYQTFDNFINRSNLLVGWGDRPKARAGEIDFAPAGITPYDTARLSALCEANEGCEVTFIIHDLRGRVIKQSRVTIEPGAGGSMDLRTAETPGAVGGRGEIVPCIRVERGQVVANFRVLDTLTGHTNLLTHPAAGLSATAAH
jgi:hypothetical protein